MLRSIKQLQRYVIRATDGEIGRVDDFFFDDRRWTIRYLVVDTGKWLPGRRVLIAPRAIVRADESTGALELDLTRDRIRDSPDIDTDQPVSRQQEVAFHSYYGYPYYWGGPGFWAHPLGMMAPPVPEYAAIPPEQARGGIAGGTSEPEGAADGGSGGDPHLRSTKEVSGYHIQARDGELGHVEDFLVEEDGWAIRALVIDTSNWIGGQSVRVPIEEVARVEWGASKVHVNRDRESLRTRGG